MSTSAMCRILADAGDLAYEATVTMKAVFDTRPDTGYDDEIAERYHFPNRYLTEAGKAIGEWIVYREPRRGGGRMAYVAVARVMQIRPDPSSSDFSYALLADYLPFDVPVPIRGPSRYYETRLEELKHPSRVGAALQGRSIREIPDIDFGAIACAGFPDTMDSVRRTREDPGDNPAAMELHNFIRSPIESQTRRIDRILINRAFRDAAFRKCVVQAYEGRCAVSGLRILNGGGRAEVQAAHILPVADGGLDIVQNGIALSSTCRWLFDRHLICLTNRYRLLVAHNRVPKELRNLFTKHGDRIHLPKDENQWPSQEFIGHHRERFAAH